MSSFALRRVALVVVAAAAAAAAVVAVVAVEIFVVDVVGVAIGNKAERQGCRQTKAVLESWLVMQQFRLLLR